MSAASRLNHTPVVTCACDVYATELLQTYDVYGTWQTPLSTATYIYLTLSVYYVCAIGHVYLTSLRIANSNAFTTKCAGI